MAGILFHINNLAVVLERAHEIRIKIRIGLHYRQRKNLVLSGNNTHDVKSSFIISEGRFV